ncbi:LamG domain-containing protein [Planctomycetota bacterium]
MAVLCLFGVMLLLVLGSDVRAAPVTDTYTDRAAFDAAAAGEVYKEHLLDLEAVATGTVICSGNDVDGVTFTYSIATGSIKLAVATSLQTTSGTHYLGLDEEDVQDQQAQHGDELDLSFSRTIRGLGMYFIAGDPLVDGDIRLVTPKGTAESIATPQLTLGDGSGVYFVGLISDQGFKTAEIRYGDPQPVAFLFNVDDIICLARKDFSGATNQDWSDPTNWADGTAPGPDDFMVLSADSTVNPAFGDTVGGLAVLGGTTVINRDLTLAGDLSVAAGAAIQVPAGITLRIQGDIGDLAGSITGAGTVIFDGSWSVEFQHKDNMNMGSELSIAVWLKLSQLGPGRQTVLSKKSAYGLFVTAAGGLTLELPEVTGSPFATPPGLITANGEWRHVVVTFRSDNGVSMWVDGVEEATHSASGDVKDSGDPVEIGQNGGIEWLDGQVDDVQLYSEKLIDEEVEDLYVRSPFVIPEPSTIALALLGALLCAAYALRRRTAGRAAG